MTIDTDAPGAGDLMLVLVMLVPLALALLGAVWLIGATIARGSLERWPRLLVHTPEQYRLLRAWVMFVPVLGPLTYGVAWCVGRAGLDPLRKADTRTPFREPDSPRDIFAASMRGTPIPGPATPWAAPPAGRVDAGASRPPHGWPPR